MTNYIEELCLHCLTELGYSLRVSNTLLVAITPLKELKLYSLELQLLLIFNVVWTSVVKCITLLLLLLLLSLLILWFTVHT